MKKSFFIISSFVLIFNSLIHSKDSENSKYVNVSINFSIERKKLEKLKAKQKFNATELTNILLGNIDQWTKHGTKIGITCQAVTPMGKWIGTFENPHYSGKSIPGGQGKNCNIWLIKKKDHPKKLLDPKNRKS